jgi:hypothetical protein
MVGQALHSFGALPCARFSPDPAIGRDRLPAEDIEGFRHEPKKLMEGIWPQENEYRQRVVGGHASAVNADELRLVAV